MTNRRHIFIYILSLAVSLLAVWPSTAGAQVRKMFTLERDSIPLFRGFQLSFDLVGPAMLMLSDYGEYEGALRLNLHDQWFPIVEIGVGHANHKRDEVTMLSYKTTAPYFRLGMDWNILRNKHQPNRLFAGFRYAFTSYKVDITRDNLPDPVWLGESGFSINGLSCSQHWLEAVIGIDAKVFGPLHLGWSVRYKRRLRHNEVPIGQTWYIPGFGTYDKDKLAATFNVIIDI